MPEYDDNPAGRLRILLMEMREANPNLDVLAWDAMARVLVPRGTPSSPTVLAAMTRLLELPSEIRAAVEALDEDEEEKEHLVEHLDKTEMFLGMVVSRTHALAQACHGFASGGEIANSAAVQSLGNCSRRLHRRSPEPVIPREEIDGLIQSITSLKDDVRASSLDSAAKLLLMRHLHALLRALDLVRISGAAPVEESLDAFTMALTHRSEAADELGQHGFLERLTAIAKTIRTTFDIARGVHQLGTEAHAVLAQGNHAIEQASRLLT